MLSGTLTQGTATVPITQARMNGAGITFVAGDRRYTGQVSDGTMSGTIEGGGSWKAAKS
jgi:hypothetical protein